MTRKIHDELAKNYLETLLQPFGEVTTAVRIRSEGREIDVVFQLSDSRPNLVGLGLLSRMIETTAIFEPFRNPATGDEIRDCIVKSIEMRRERKRDERRKGSQKTTTSKDGDIPFLWILTPTLSTKILKQFAAGTKKSWYDGIYFFPEGFRAAITVIHQLPQQEDTLWLRLLGKGKVQEQAIEELLGLSRNNPFRDGTLKVFYSLFKDLDANRTKNEEDQELVMRLSPLYLEDREKAVQEGIQQGMQQGMQQGVQALLETVLKNSFGELDSELERAMGSMLQLPREELASLLLQLSSLSRQELLERFGK